MSKSTKPNEFVKRRLFKLLVIAALALTTFVPLAVSSSTTQMQSIEASATPTPTPDPLKPPSEFQVSWNT
jgi:hypothetical protein